MLDPQKNTPYLTLTGELWSGFCEYLWENWLRYNGAALYLHIHVLIFQVTEMSYLLCL